MMSNELVDYLRCDFVFSLMRESEQGLKHEGQKLQRFHAAHKSTKDVHTRASQIESENARRDYFKDNKSVYANEEEYWSTKL